MSSELEQVKAAFLAHKTETQRRFDELTKVHSFSWEKYQEIMAAAALVPGLQADLAAAAQREAALTQEVGACREEIARLRAQAAPAEAAG